MRIQVSEDGGLTKLLKSRTDRAVKFAEMQKKQTGRDIADELGIPMEGIGAGTKSYFWINAFISEFIAALHYYISFKRVTKYD